MLKQRFCFATFAALLGACGGEHLSMSQALDDMATHLDAFERDVIDHGDRMQQEARINMMQERSDVFASLEGRQLMRAVSHVGAMADRMEEMRACRMGGQVPDLFIIADTLGEMRRECERHRLDVLGLDDFKAVLQEEERHRDDVRRLVATVRLRHGEMAADGARFDCPMGSHHGSR